ncbi:HU family DNA-binding protein [Shewanella benthica]|uniref:HU family DNA-binding protein n=1 Tax=Shewanella TaxID=22 RepID=UPI00187A5FED|nr:MULTISPECIES: HU family DNA-binding protein [Shewanella]MBE7214486.1 HU family DNA-binding protein [Shewanella benthica]MBL4816005.1 HU family DNA-binding protein [Shewanella sp.]MCJ8301256.1 HU family DNA-binding protein [Shewanella sp.]MCL1061552.1 HU family DNA-binding protein [Shewanella benthica]
MNKTELVAKMAENADLTKAEAARALKSFEETITAALKSGDKISIIGFGSFETTNRAARIGRNPQTGKEIQIPAATVPKFKAGKTLKDSVNQ